MFIALGGGAHAAIKLPNNSVGTAQIKAKAITPPKVARSTVTLFKGQKGDQGPQGPRGLTGERGPQGIQGPTGATGATGQAGEKRATGETGAPGSALAYADVRSDGTLVAGRSKGVVSVVKPEGSTGLYCFDLGVPVVNGVGSAHYGGTYHSGFPRVDIPAVGFCNSSPNNIDASVVMTINNSTNGEDDPFYIAFN